MKLFFWLIVAVNLIFFALMTLGPLYDARTVPLPQALHEEKITLMNVTQISVAQSAVPAVLPESTPPASATLSQELACFEWGEFVGPDLERATKGLGNMQLGDRLRLRETEHAIGYWVYISPLQGKTEVSQKVAQLKARGVVDYFVVQDAGSWRNAISLGVFKTRESAQNYLDGLRAKGVHSAQIGERSGKTKAVVFEIAGLTVQMIDKLTAFQKEFAGIELKRVSCH